VFLFLEKIELKKLKKKIECFFLSSFAIQKKILPSKLFKKKKVKFKKKLTEKNGIQGT
jgi:hypothetical protein